MKRLFGFMLLVTALCSCAHVAAVATACKPAPTDVDTALTDLQADDWKAELDSLLIAKGSCIARAAVAQVVAALKGRSQLAMPAGTPSSAEIVARGEEWLNTPQ